jgi:KipI family sensor histidine kinase inhibitor
MEERTPAAPRVSALGCATLLFESEGEFGNSAQERVWYVGELAQAWDGVQEAVPGMNNLMIVFDPAMVTRDVLIDKVRTAWRDDRAMVRSGKLVELPVVYGGAAGPDLETVAAHAGLSLDDVVRIHSQALYTVYFLGAHPGFGYLAGLDSRLHTPRRSEPRLQVPAGTVAIGGQQTGAIAQTSPSGWQLIGRTERTFFDPSASPPALLAPGDRVRFQVVGIER